MPGGPSSEPPSQVRLDFGRVLADAGEGPVLAPAVIEVPLPADAHPAAERKRGVDHGLLQIMVSREAIDVVDDLHGVADSRELQSVTRENPTQREPQSRAEVVVPVRPVLELGVHGGQDDGLAHGAGGQPQLAAQLEAGHHADIDTLAPQPVRRGVVIVIVLGDEEGVARPLAVIQSLAVEPAVYRQASYDLLLLRVELRAEEEYVERLAVLLLQRIAAEEIEGEEETPVAFTEPVAFVHDPEAHPHPAS